MFYIKALAAIQENRKEGDGFCLVFQFFPDGCLYHIETSALMDSASCFKTGQFHKSPPKPKHFYPNSYKETRQSIP